MIEDTVNLLVFLAPHVSYANWLTAIKAAKGYISLSIV
jgi:hypothetical protein